MYRGLVFALIVGLAGVALSVVPGLFIQSIFIGEAQRCVEAQERDIAIGGEIVTDCADDFVDAPYWLPPTIIIGGGVMGALGGFGYGFIAPKAAPRRGDHASRPWLPF